jgi:hypothetical protein
VETSDNLVWVYRYRYWNPSPDHFVTSDRLATLDAIKDGLGIPVLESGMRISRNYLDERGCSLIPAGQP